METSSSVAGSATVRLRPMSVVLLVLGVGATSAAFVSKSPALLFLALPMLAAPLAALVSVPARPGRVTLRWTEGGSGPEIAIDGEVEGAGALALGALSLGIVPPAPIVEDRPPRYRKDGALLRFHLSWRAPYPLIATAPPPTASLVEPLGLAERPLAIDGEALRIERFPPEAARVGAIPLRRTTVLPGEVASRTIGASGEFFGVRYAVPGDSPRRINWRASGRLGRTCVNEFRLERTGDLLIVLDARPTSLGSAEDAALLSIGRAAAHGIASAFLHEKDRVGLAVFGEYLDAVPLGSGRTHGYRIARLLDRARVSEVAGPPERLAVSLRRSYAPGVSTLLISPLAEEESYHVLPHLRRRGFPTFVLSPSPLPRLAATLPDAPEGRSLRRLVRLIRRARMGEVWEEAPVLDWDDYWTLAGLPGLFRLPSRSGGRR